MDLKQLRALLRGGEATVGTWQQLPSADVGEMLARGGYDWVAVDLEHGSFGLASLPNIFRGIECGGALPFARLPEASKVWIKGALEAGAQGLIFPMIESAAQLNAAIDLATYPGDDGWREAEQVAEAYRGIGFCRANGFGQSFDDYRRHTAPEIFLVAQIEHIKAVAELDAILSHPRLDAIMVGPYDLSGSMGLTGQFEHLRFQETMGVIAAKCLEHGVVMGSHVVTPDVQALGREIKRGCQFLAYGIDTVFLWQGARRPQLC